MVREGFWVEYFSVVWCGVVRSERKERKYTAITWSRAMNSWLFSMRTYACDDISDGHTLRDP